MCCKRSVTPLKVQTLKSTATTTTTIVETTTTTTTTTTTKPTTQTAKGAPTTTTINAMPEALKTLAETRKVHATTTTTTKATTTKASTTKISSATTTTINAKQYKSLNATTKTPTTKTKPTTTTTITQMATATTTAHRKRLCSQRARSAAPAAASTRCTRRWCLLAFYSTLLAAHATFGSELKSHTIKYATTTTTTTARPLIKVTTTTTKATATAASQPEYSQPLAAGNFRPIIPTDLTPEDITRQTFTPKGQYRVFESAESDLRATSTMRQHDKATSHGKVQQHPVASTPMPPQLTVNEIPTTSDKELEALLTEYVQNFFERGHIEPLPGLVFALQKNGTHMGIATPVLGVSSEQLNDAGDAEDDDDEAVLRRHVRNAVKVQRSGGRDGGVGDSVVSINIPRALQSGRLLFFAGLKKVLWPVYMGLQILKSLLFALLLPTLIGSVGKLLGKGIISGSAPLFIRPMDAPQEVDFKDNSLNFDDDSKFAMSNDFEGTKDDGYAYNQPEASQTHNQYAYNAASINQQALSRYGNEQQKMQDSYLSALQSLSSASFKNSNSISGSSSGGLGGLGGGGGGGLLGGGLAGGDSLGDGGVSLTAPTRQSSKPIAPANVNTFQTFQKVPASSLLLSNYDPFYSPLLSRLDSVFAQLKLNTESEVCREKLICLMYANPAKYAPYSNLVSAQLSRELNELRKPTSDNPDILRFFKYMRAAKDGQDGVDCEKTFASCDEFKDFENPAMVSTYHDINKLVQARKMT